MKRIIPLSLTLGIVVAASGWAQGPSPPAPIPALAISGKTEIPFYGFCALELVGAHSSSTMWVVFPDPFQEDDDGQVTHFTAIPGSYKVLTFCVVNGSPYLFKTSVVFLPPPGPLPPPNPGPGPLPPPPNPNPTPAPTGNVWAIAIFDMAQDVSLPTGQLAVKGSPTIAAAVKAVGAIWRRYDIHEKVPHGSDLIGVTETNWGIDAAKVGWPALVFTDSAGHIVAHAQKLPPDEAGVVAAVKAALGK